MKSRPAARSRLEGPGTSKGGHQPRAEKTASPSIMAASEFRFVLHLIFVLLYLLDPVQRIGGP